MSTPSQSAMRASHKIMLHGASRGFGIMNQFTIEEIIDAELAPERAARKELVEALEAARRLTEYCYHSWAVSGGPDECKHGYNKGIPCEKCDRDLLRATLAKHRGDV